LRLTRLSQNKIAVAVGVTSIGTLAHYQELFWHVGIACHQLLNITSGCNLNAARHTRIAKEKTAEGKKI